MRTSHRPSAMSLFAPLSASRDEAHMVEDRLDPRIAGRKSIYCAFSAASPARVEEPMGHGDGSLGIGDWCRPHRRLMIRPCARLRRPAFYRSHRFALHYLGWLATRARASLSLVAPETHGRSQQELGIECQRVRSQNRPSGRDDNALFRTAPAIGTAVLALFRGAPQLHRYTSGEQCTGNCCIEPSTCRNAP